MPSFKLDKEEREIEKALEQGKLKRSPDFEIQKKKLMRAAKNTLTKNKNVNLRISERDLFRVKSKAASQGVPYQTLLTSLIHQYSNDQIEYNVLREPKGKYKTS